MGDLTLKGVNMERNTVITQALSWLGKNEKDSSFKEIIDIYNSKRPLPRGYKVKYTDSWCAVFVSAVAIKSGTDKKIPLECSCGRMIEKAQAQGIWVENDGYIPKKSDIILYDWNDSGKGENKGWPEHVGIVEKVENGVITVIEGNLDNKVAKREIKVNARYIRGFICPPYTEETTVQKEYYPKYTGNTVSIVDALKSLKIDSSYAHRKEIAIKNGITEYSGKAKENGRLLELLRNGTLEKEN